MKLFLIVITVIFLLSISFFSVLALYVVHPRRHTLESSRGCEEKAGVFGNFDFLTSTSYLIRSHDNYELHAEFFTAPEPIFRYLMGAS